MLTSRDFLIGVVAGVAAVYVYHHFVNPLPGPNLAAHRKMGG